MELEHRIGQLLLISLPGSEMDASTRELLETVQPGGILLEGRNIESAQQAHELTSAIRQIINVPPFIAIAQEGGRVDPLKEIFSPLPSADHLRASDDASISARFGEITAEALRTLGCNINLAPVLDIARNDSAENGLKGRYLGNTVAEVVRLAGAYLEGLQRGGIIGIGKHFPGLGAAREDPQNALPTIDRSRDELQKQEVAPYTELFSKINARLTSVIVGHAHYPALDGPAALPASLSKNVVNGFLRDELGYRGLAIADNLEMGAVRSTRDLPEAAVMAIEAGNDMAIVSGSADRIDIAWRAMIEAARQNRINNTHISRAFDHIARVKSMVSPPLSLSEMSVARIRERVAELNLVLQHSK